MLKTIEQNNGKFKLAIIISTVLHIALFSVLIWSSLDKHINISANTFPRSTITASIVDSVGIEALHHNSCQQENVDSNKEKEKKDEKQTQKQKKEFHKKQIEDIAVKAITNSKEKADTNSKRPEEIGKKIVEIAKKTLVGAKKKVETEFTKKVSKKIIPPDVNKLFNELVSDRNVPKTGNRMKGNNISPVISNDTENNEVSSDEIKSYARKLKLAIEDHFYSVSSYVGKTCILRIKLAPDGALLNIKPEEGDLALCNAALAAARQAKIPKPTSQSVYEVFKNALLDFKP